MAARDYCARSGKRLWLWSESSGLSRGSTPDAIGRRDLVEVTVNYRFTKFVYAGRMKRLKAVACVALACSARLVRERAGRRRSIDRSREPRDAAAAGGGRLRAMPAGVAAEASIPRRLHAAERHLRLVMHRRPVDVTHTRVDTSSELQRTRNVATVDGRAQPIFTVVATRTASSSS